MRYSNLHDSIVAQWSVPGGNRVKPFLMSAPGGGKSALCREIMRTMGFETVIEFTPSLRDPVDLLGTPNNTGPFTKWVPPEDFYKLRQGVGRCGLIIEELSDAPVQMQNPMCGIINDNVAGSFKLSDELHIIASGNRVEDKSGASKITTKLAGRMRILNYTENLEDLTAYALDAGWKTDLIQFLRWRPGKISDFDPNRLCNATPRTWEKVNLIPESLPPQDYLEHVSGDVGEGSAAEYVGFKRIFHSLPSIDGLLLDPANADVPSDPAVRYAIAGAVARKATENNFAAVATYANRMPPEFSVTLVKDAIKLCPKIKSTRAFIEWATKNSEVLM